MLTFIKNEGPKAIVLATIALVLGLSLYVSSEPSLIQAATSGSSVVITLNVTTGVAITSPGNTTMSNSMGAAVNTAVATSTFTVTTNDSLGYTLAVTASTTPAMQSGSNTIPDMGSTPATWSVPNGATQFGFSAFGTDVNTGTYGSDTACQGATSTPSSSLKYRGFAGATPITIASRNSTTTPSGNAVTVCYAAGQNNTYIPSGIYTATITATATSN